MAISQSSSARPNAQIIRAAVHCPKGGASIPITEALSRQSGDIVKREYEFPTLPLPDPADS